MSKKTFGTTSSRKEEASAVSEGPVSQDIKNASKDFRDRLRQLEVLDLNEFTGGHKECRKLMDEEKIRVGRIICMIRTFEHHVLKEEWPWPGPEGNCF